MEPKPESSAQASPESSSEAPAVASSSSQEPAAAAAVEPSSSAEPQPTNLVVTPPMPDNLVFEASRARNAPIALKGAVPAAAAAAYFGSIAGGVPTDALVVTPGMPVAFITDALGGLDALGRLVEGRLGFDGSRWWLRGKAEAAAVKDGVAATVAALPGGAAWSVAIDLLSPIDICSDKVAAVAGRNAILFKSGSATIVPDSMPILDELAADLEICPNTYVHVEGHTDGDGPEDVNLALSVARAEAVVAELIARGVGEERLYAEGYGESKPVAPNDTKQGKAQNRRIAFTISPE
jgi:outer membrane protein OmpA-like peptidoglycan-associated protein